MISLTNDARKRPEHCNGSLILIDCIYAYIRGLNINFNLAKTMVSVLHYKELEYKVEKLKYKKLEVMQPRMKNKSVN